ncbi:TcfC E-set like domain-containing protein [Burkholderia multivorans]|uniref:TcfC E-set like domain-containing protein n=1 Tax=Burkholderia multivorans TaxID=87883 RepID=UPI001C947B58|nr:TcfC E-set like domain-containing protein [Burkholderia multivorans]MBY4672337.1 TcfC E-set like domain-containing protein [Burkholderia multivorans]
MLPFEFKKTMAACLGVLCLSDLLAQAHAATVPAGFEDIAAGSEERIEVNFLGKSLGLFRVFVTPETVRFEEPDRLVRALGDRVDMRKHEAAMKSSLSNGMPRNGNLLCDGQTGIGNCGYVDTDSAAVIYDESNGVINLFVTRDWLGNVEREHRYYELSSATERALIHRQTMNLSSGRGYRSLSVAGTGALGLTPRSFIGGNWNFAHSSYGRNSDSQLQVQDIYLRHDFGPAHYAQLGRMDNRNLASSIGGNFGFTMLPTGTIDGMRVGTTLAYVNSATADRGTPIMLLLPRDARIDAYRGKELLGTFYLKAGVNPLDTSRFPEGSYPVTLRVFEDGVQVRTQTSPFTKTGGSAGARTRQWFAQAGRVAERGTQSPSGVVMAGGVRVPLPGNIALTSGIASVDSHVYNETALEWSHAFPLGMLSAAGSYFAGSDGSRGNTQQLSFVDGVSWSIYRYQMRGAACSGGNGGYRGIGCYDTLNATVSFPLGNWSAMFGYTYNKSLGRSMFDGNDIPDRPWASSPPPSADRVTRALQLGLSRSSTWRKINVSTRVGVYANRGSGDMHDYGGYVGVTLSFAEPASASRRASAYSSVSLDVRSNRNETTTNYTLDRNWSWQGDSYRELEASVSGYGADSLTGQLQGRWNGRYGDVTAAVANSYSRDDGSNSSVTASYSSSFALARQGLFFGAASSQTDPIAGFAVKVSERDGVRGTAADASTTSGNRVKVGFGQRALLPVTAFAPVTTEVRDAGAQVSSGATSLTEGLGKRTVFMTPGHLAMRKVEAKVTYTYVGQAVSPGGLPLADSVILNASVPPLDDEGGFVAEFERKERELFVVDGPALMRCPLHVERQRDVIMMVGKVRCELAGPEALPELLRNEARVQRLLQQRYVMSTRAKTIDPQSTN